MNVTIRHDIKRGISLKTRYIAAVAGVALAVSAVVIGGARQDSGSSNEAAVRDGHVHVIRQTAPQQYHFYIVSSEAERAAILSASAELAILSASNELALVSQRPSVHVLVASSPEADVFLTEGARELQQFGVNYTVTNMTRPSSGR